MLFARHRGKFAKLFYYSSISFEAGWVLRGGWNMRNYSINSLHRELVLAPQVKTTFTQAVWFGIIMRTFTMKMIFLHVYLLHKQCLCLAFCPLKVLRIISPVLFSEPSQYQFASLGKTVQVCPAVIIVFLCCACSVLSYGGDGH